MNRFVRCPHCKMPHDAAERVCSNTGLRLPVEGRAQTREGQRAEVRRPQVMSEMPPPERRPEPLGFNTHVPDRASSARPADVPAALPATRDHRNDLIGQTVSGRYRVKGVLGEGGMGTVYDAEHLGLSRQVAIKVLSPAQAKKKVAVKRFQQEARAAGAIGHPNICEVYDLGLLDDGSPYLVMEKLIGQTLAERIGKEGGLPFDEVIEVIVQVLSGLVAAHEKGIVHRDIKPENIFLARRLAAPPIIKLLDFGVSKMMPEFQTGEDHLDLTRTGMVMGTPYYMSPEQARGERNLDGRVDVYACGVVMYEAIVGKRPFLAPNYNALLLAIINTLPKPLREARPKTPPELEAIVVKAMSKNRNDRYATAKHFLRELAPVPAAEGSASRLPPPPTADERKRALILGGGRSRDSARDSRPEQGRSEANVRARRPEAAPSVRPHEPIDRPDGPAATLLRNRMADPKVVPYETPRRRDTPLPSLSDGVDSDSHISFGGVRDYSSDTGSSDVDIPIDVGTPTDQDEDEDNHAAADNDATRIFQPGRHPAPRFPVVPPPARASQPRANRRPSSTPPANASEDWDGETVVTHQERRSHAEGPPSAPPARAAKATVRRREPKPFNPDDTLKLDSTSSDIEIFDDQQAPPRRR